MAILQNCNNNFIDRVRELQRGFKMVTEKRFCLCVYYIHGVCLDRIRVCKFIGIELKVKIHFREALAHVILGIQSKNKISYVFR